MAAYKSLKPSYFNKGFTLVELLLALGLSGIVLTGIASTMLAINKTQSLAQDYLNLQDSQSFINSSFILASDAALEVDSSTITNNKLGLRLRANRTSCLFTKPTQSYYQTYYLENGKLMCQVKQASDSSILGTEALAYGVKSLSFECAEMGRDIEIAYLGCASSSLDLGDVRSIKIKYTLDKSSFIELNKDITNTRVVTFSY